MAGRARLVNRARLRRFFKQQTGLRRRPPALAKGANHHSNAAPIAGKTHQIADRNQIGGLVQPAHRACPKQPHPAGRNKLRRLASRLEESRPTKPHIDAGAISVADFPGPVHDARRAGRRRRRGDFDAGAASAARAANGE